ncbi:hypothetical protein QTG54_000019 [Skeletonema marinoi]|uniref:Uncharacterized protein n=1 Tax=Skeletonema marinoi TaxID=267567 RepID=A0AAD9DJK2_9STRA|nr:hypothetical protein QTG54_000019 [Skeletonema marinoi]
MSKQSFQAWSCLLLMAILAAPENCNVYGFTVITTQPSAKHHSTIDDMNIDTSTSLHNSYSSDNTNNQDESSVLPSSGLKALLPKPASRPLKMDKFGRRIYRMEDDTTVRHTKGTSVASGGTAAAAPEKIVAGDRSSVAAVTSDSDNNSGGDSYTASPTSTTTSLSNLLTDSKQLAGDKSLQATFENVNDSSDLKSLLPSAKMRFMKLDKFGRRVQRMEDDGSVSYSRGSGAAGENDASRNDDVGVVEGVNAIRGVKGGDDDVFTSGSAVQQQQQQQLPPVASRKRAKSKKASSNVSNSKQQAAVEQQAAAVEQQVVEQGPSLAKLIKAPQPTPDLLKDASTSTGIHGADLKSLLPSAKMRFMKLDKFGRRVQRMEDDGSVSYSRGSGAGESASSDSGVGGGGGGVEEVNTIGNLESESTIDLGTRQTSDSYVNQSGSSVNLKDLAGISKRPVFTKLDFKGGSVEDDRRMTSTSSSVPTQTDEGAAAAPASGLKELALSSKRPMFTKLDFKGGSVVDERRTKKAPSTNTAEVSTTQGNLKDLLPTRPTFTKLDFKGGNVEDERRTKKQPSSSTPALATSTPSSGSLKTLLPERKFMWKKQEQRRSTTNDFIGSVRGDSIARSTTATNSVREAKQKAMRDEVISAAAATNSESGNDVVGDDDEPSGGGEGEGSYSNLTDLLPRKKFVFRDTK